MSHKFTIVVEVKNDKPVSYAFLKEKANDAVVLFNKLRDSGVEAYLFQHPRADKRSKSDEQKEASVPTKVILAPKTESIIATAKSKRPNKNNIDGVSI